MPSVDQTNRLHNLGVALQLNPQFRRHLQVLGASGHDGHRAARAGLARCRRHRRVHGSGTAWRRCRPSVRRCAAMRQTPMCSRSAISAFRVRGLAAGSGWPARRRSCRPASWWS
jgi:hypothetical protein